MKKIIAKEVNPAYECVETAARPSTGSDLPVPMRQIRRRRKEKC